MYAAGNTTRLYYERAVLKYMYYHNWFTGNNGCTGNKEGGCSNQYYSNAFYIGIASENKTALEHIGQLAALRPSSVQTWEANVTLQDDAYNYGSMPPEARAILGGAWNRGDPDDNCTVSSLPHMGISLLTNPIAGFSSFAVKCPSDLRVMEKAKWNPRLLSFDQYKAWHFAFYFDVRPNVKAEAGYSLGITTFVCFVLCVASVFFSKDANTLVLEPVETMITKVNTIRENPLIAMKMADDEFRLEEIKKTAEARARKEVMISTIKSFVYCKSMHREELMETVILDKTIIKLGTLLALGFGEAGANIVSHTMGGSTGSNSVMVDAMVAGSRVDCIVGLVRIRDFSVATEVLQGKVMTFVNQVAEIVHGIVDEFAGAANKNNGETFMLVWRTEGYRVAEAAKAADMSLVAFAKVLGAVHRSRTLAIYRGHPALKQRLRNGWRVNLTIGLHFGWAIEGAVGSEFKIDASYLSPNVSIAGSVEHAASIYDVSICATESLVGKCTKEMAKKLRMIDRVIIKGSSKPLDLYSLDLDYWSLQVDEPKPRCFIWNLRQRYKARQMLEAEKNHKWMTDVSMPGIFDESPDIAIMRGAYVEEFLETFNMGYQNYHEGEWGVARRLLMITQDFLGFRDGPSVALLRFMNTYRFEAPDKWEGVHHFETLEHLEEHGAAEGRGHTPGSPKSMETTKSSSVEFLQYPTTPTGPDNQGLQ
jgi:class 3 adenylate cyclase